LTRTRVIALIGCDEIGRIFAEDWRAESDRILAALNPKDPT